jgi:methionyl-tRNA formyltransferase
MHILFLLVDEPFYTPACVEPLLERWGSSVVGGAFPKGFFDRKRVKTSLRLYGVVGTATRTARVVWAGIRGGAVHRQFASRGLRIIDVEDVNAPGFLDDLSRLGVDVIVSLNCPQRLKRGILALPARGCINVHFGLLPKYRGILPIFHALLNREPSFGVTVHFMDEKLDNGDIIAQRAVPILPGDTLETLYPKGFATATVLLNEALEALTRGAVPRRPNPESEKSYYSYPTPEMVRTYHRLARTRGERGGTDQ